MSQVLFAYGTLRRGESRDLLRLFPSARYLGNGTIDGTLYDLGAYPGISCGAGCSVVGELFEVDEETLSAVDEIEGCIIGDSAASYFSRDLFEVRSETLGAVRAWVYQHNPARYVRGVPIDAEDWVGYRAARGTDPPDEWPE
jgi:gamma-glutamylcyclotransferase (GGCT)/AIG2-like uncharacterized protein YtfP